MTKEDFVNEIFMAGINISLFTLPHKELLISIGKDEEKRQAFIRHLKNLNSNITFCLNALRTEEDVIRYSEASDKSMHLWLSGLKQNGVNINKDNLDKYKEVVLSFISLLENANNDAEGAKSE